MAVADIDIGHPPTGLAPPSTAEGSRSHRFWTAFWKDAEIYIPLFFLVLFMAACFLGPVIFPIPGPNVGSIGSANLPPLSRGAVFGTDLLGNDQLSRLLYGGRISFEVGIGAQVLGLLVGSLIGMFAGFRGGFFGSAIMRVMDMLLAIPGLVIVIVVATFLGASLIHVIWAISFFTTPAMARLARAQTLRLRNQDFITASSLAGERSFGILWRHLAPNVYPQLLTFVCLGIGQAIIVEAALSFLGLGVPPPAPSWGNMISAGEADFSNPYLIIIPGAALLVTVLFLNLLGDALRSRISSR